MKGVKAKKKHIDTASKKKKHNAKLHPSQLPIPESGPQENVKKTQFSSSTDRSLIFPARRPTTCAARVRLHDSARSGSTHGPSMLKCGMRRPRFERYSIFTCGMEPPCTTEQKHFHARAFKPALTHTYPHLRTIPTPKPDVSEHEGRSPQQNMNVPSAGRNMFNCKKHIASVFGHPTSDVLSVRDPESVHRDTMMIGACASLSPLRMLVVCSFDT